MKTDNTTKIEIFANSKPSFKQGLWRYGAFAWINKLGIKNNNVFFFGQHRNEIETAQLSQNKDFILTFDGSETYVWATSTGICLNANDPIVAPWTFLCGNLLCILLNKELKVCSPINPKKAFQTYPLPPGSNIFHDPNMPIVYIQTQTDIKFINLTSNTQGRTQALTDSKSKVHAICSQQLNNTLQMLYILSSKDRKYLVHTATKNKIRLLCSIDVTPNSSDWLKVHLMENFLIIIINSQPFIFNLANHGRAIKTTQNKDWKIEIESTNCHILRLNTEKYTYRISLCKSLTYVEKKYAKPCYSARYIR